MPKNKRADEGFPMSVIFDPHGRATLLRGHNLSEEEIQIAYEDEFGDRGSPEIEELYLYEHRRVKWCDRLDGPCDLNGDWHRHFEGMHPSESDNRKFTLVFPAEEPTK